MAEHALSTPASALLRTVPRSLWPEAVRERERRLARGLRRLEDLREEMIAKLDELAGDPDFEPSLSAPEHPAHLRGFYGNRAAEVFVWAQGCDDDREGDGGRAWDMGEALDSDFEPSLGAPAAMDQTRWARGGNHDLELATEDDERSLGWPEQASIRGQLGLGSDECEDIGEAEPEEWL